MVFFYFVWFIALAVGRSNRNLKSESPVMWKDESNHLYGIGKIIVDRTHFLVVKRFYITSRKSLST